MTSLMTTQQPDHPKVIVLPVSPQVLARNRFAAPGSSSQAMRPEEALAWLEGRLAHKGQGYEVELAGPGDPLATPQLTFEILHLLRKRYAKLDFSITTLGISGDQQAQTLAALGVRRITVLLDAVDTETVQRLYLWIRPAKRTIPLIQAAKLLLGEQATAIAAFRREGIAVKVKTTVYPGVNDNHVGKIARQAAAMGAKAMAVLPCLSAVVDGVSIAAPSKELIAKLQRLSARYLSGVEAETPEYDADRIQPATPADAVSMRPGHRAARPNVALVSSNGLEIDLHLGQASRVLIYGPRGDGLISLLGSRTVPAAGETNGRWDRLAKILPDCFALLVANAGDAPRTILHKHGIPLLITGGDIEGAVDLIFGNGKKNKKESISWQFPNDKS